VSYTRASIAASAGGSKELRPDVAMDPTLRARFVREARVQGQLEHPAIVPVYDIGVRADGAPYFTMKDITGGDNRLVVLPTALDLPRVPTLTLVIGAAAAGVLIGTVIIGYIRDRLASAERRLYLYNGQLEIEMPMLTKTTARRG
jgi:hypothetical protein